MKARQSRKPAVSSEKRKSLDILMTGVSISMVKDFQRGLSDPQFCSELPRLFASGNIAAVREALPALDYSDDVYTFKVKYQMNSLLKRHRYQDDTYSTRELEAMAIAKFLETQERVSLVDLNNLCTEHKVILQLARLYVSKLLGPYCPVEHRSLCRFGRKASVGVRARDACEAARWEVPLTGSSDQISWFASDLRPDEPWSRYLRNQVDSDVKSIYREIDSLKLTFVPKTYKSLRAIMPNSTIGTYMSYGLGEMIRKRLKRGGYDLKTLQERHKAIARSASVHKQWVTADLSSASDSITDPLVRALFPQDWYEILCQSRIKKVTLPNGNTIDSETFCTMGIGYTFPLQSLVFLAMLKAVEAFYYGRFDKRLISVYGDDMIYSSRMHQQVVGFFTAVGFVINLDKTFHDVYFRESCGGDYYHGVDVRPFQPENGSTFVTKRSYEAVLYKYINTLLMRWSEHELTLTLEYLVSEFIAAGIFPKKVPSDYPDDSGIKCPTLRHWKFLDGVKCAEPKHMSHGRFRFFFLRFKPKLRKEDRHEPYLWVRLRGLGELYQYDTGSPPAVPTRAQCLINDTCGVRDTASPLIWEKGERGSFVRSKITGKRYRRLVSFSVINGEGHYTRQSGTSCFEDRR